VTRFNVKYNIATSRGLVVAEMTFCTYKEGRIVRQTAEGVCNGIRLEKMHRMKGGARETWCAWKRFGLGYTMCPVPSLEHVLQTCANITPRPIRSY
jgi:hypothetical protein